MGCLLFQFPLGVMGQTSGVSNSPTGTPTTLDAVEGVRGGRHWIDQATAAPCSPSEALQRFRLEPGFEVRLVAAEPLVRDPVAIAFDRWGRLFVVEYGDYPSGPEDGGDPLSRVVFLEDVNQDGTADRRHVFADKLHFAHSLMPYDDGFLVAAQTKLLFLKDTDGDHQADVRETWLDGFTPAHPQMQVGNPRWGIDNWVYVNYGPGSVVTRRHPNSKVSLPRKDFRFHPRTFELQPDSGMGQYGNTVDRWGNRFYATNRNPIMATILPPPILHRNPFAVVSIGHADVGPSGGATRVYPLVEMKSNYLSHAGTHTSACGVTAYQGDLFGEEFFDSVFVCEPIGHLVTRTVIQHGGVAMAGRRARQGADFLASTDTWFRPSSLANGPDGALYLADMYRLWVEHPKFLPKDIAERLDWRAGDDRGRIYRIAPESAEPRRFVPPQAGDEIVTLLEDRNAWRQFLGQRLLVQQQDISVTPVVREVLRNSDDETARLHALWTIHGLGQLTLDDTLRSLRDPGAFVRLSGAKLSAEWPTDDAVLRQLAEAANDADPRVRLQVLLTLGGWNQDIVTPLLIQIALRDGRDPWFARALLSSVATRAGPVLTGLVSATSFVEQPHPSAAGLVKDLASVVGARGHANEVRNLLRLVAAPRPRGYWWRVAALNGLGKGLPRQRGALAIRDLSTLLAKPPESLLAPTQRIRELLRTAEKVALDPTQSLVDRVGSIELLAHQSLQNSLVPFERLLSTQQPVAIQSAVIEVIANNGSEAAAELVLSRWTRLGPSVRPSALAFLLRRPSTTRMALSAMASGDVSPASLSIEQRLRLLRHSDTTIQQNALQLFGGAVSADRQKIVQQYHSALTIQGSVAEGRTVFRRVCAKCHRVHGVGHLAGPDISDVRNRAPAALLYDILDPNAKVEPRFALYVVTTRDGRVFEGLIRAESPQAVVLRMPEGKEQEIDRSDIEHIRATNVSLMPEGIEKEISLQQMADLLEFLKTRNVGAQ